VGAEVGRVSTRPAFYAARPGGWRDWWTILHPPYTAWHLSYVVVGAALAPRVDGGRLGATLVAFFLAVGIGAHALDELHGRPLRTQISSRLLVIAAVGSLVGSLALGFAGISRVGAGLLVFMIVGVVLVLGYNLELFGGALHTDFGFAVGWGAFPVLTAYFVQAERIDASACLAALFAFALSLAQRALSTQARFVRRRTVSVEGTMTTADGITEPFGEWQLLAPLEGSLRWMSMATVALASALLFARVW
jgi:hypothetical protein